MDTGEADFCEGGGVLIQFGKDADINSKSRFLQLSDLFRTGGY